jgi:hypothetical protein
LNKFLNPVLKSPFTKISLFIGIGIFICACNAIKNVPEAKQLLVKNQILIDGKPGTDLLVENLLVQKPNTAIFGYKTRLNLFNLAKQNADSLYKDDFLKNPDKLKNQSWLLSEKQVKRKGESFLYSGFHKFLIKNGEPPTILDEKKTEKSAARIKSYFFNQGFFNAKVIVKAGSIGIKRTKLNYEINRGQASIIDSINTAIETSALDSLYKSAKNLSEIKSGRPYNGSNFEDEKNRIATLFRNSGAYEFQPSNVLFDLDTIGTGNKTNVLLRIKNQQVRTNDTLNSMPFVLYKISRVNIFTNLPSEKFRTITDSVVYKNFHLYSYGKLKYKPKAITDAIFINQGNFYSDIRDNLSRRYLTNLRIFNFPSISYLSDPKNDKVLIAKIVLSPKKKYSFGWSTDLLHSNIQQFGLAAGVTLGVRNVFNKAETFDLGIRANPGFSRDLANPNNNFFNILEYGIDLKLNFPRILFPIYTDRIISKAMIPSTTVNLGFTKQENIGLDKENFMGAMFYSWTPKRNNTARFDFFNMQYVNNINVTNYFNVYRSSYNLLNDFAAVYNTNPGNVDQNGNLTIASGGSNNFIADVLNDVTAVPAEVFKSIRSIEKRRQRLTENNLILSTSYSFSKTTRSSNTDSQFYTFKTKIEAAGNVLSLFAAATAEIDDSQNKKKIFNIEYSQFIKTELEFIKHWDLQNEKVFAIRGFFGLAVPYGNSSNIPFSRSYFAGGSNDMRAWQPYSLGSGASGSINEFNEANLKITTSAEFRFKILNDLKGALFVDAGNIWNVFDDVRDKPSMFEGLQSLKNMAVGSGLGFRYDLNFFVFRVDLGYKAYNPSYEEDQRWFRDFNFSKTVLNIGINYPF